MYAFPVYPRVFVNMPVHTREVSMHLLDIEKLLDFGSDDINRRKTNDEKWIIWVASQNDFL